MGIFLMYDIEAQIVYLTSGKTKSNSLNGGPLGSVAFFSWGSFFSLGVLVTD